jgi:hypothetical protein
MHICIHTILKSYYTYIQKESMTTAAHLVQHTESKLPAATRPMHRRQMTQRISFTGLENLIASARPYAQAERRQQQQQQQHDPSLDRLGTLESPFARRDVQNCTCNLRTRRLCRVHRQHPPVAHPPAVLLAHNTPAAGRKGEEKQLNVGGLRQRVKIWAATAGAAVLDSLAQSRPGR